jgi:ADP-ribose pyrophosphatase YjhB (NUDIX family)
MVLRRIGLENQQRFICQSCGHVFFEGPRVLVGCIAFQDGRLLMCQRAEAPERGRWVIPGGFMENNEHLEQATAREVEEESGVKIDADRLTLYSILSMPFMNQVWVTFRTELPPDARLIPGPEALSVRMIGENELAPDEYAFSSSLMGLSCMFREIRSQQFGIHMWRLDAPGAKLSGVHSYALREIAN